MAALSYAFFVLWATVPPPIRLAVPPEDKAWNWDMLFWHLAQVVIYVLVGLGLFGVAFLMISKVTPFSIRKEIEEDQNVALGIVLGAVIIGIAIILAAAIRG